jgi:hypothetical protein
VNEVVRLKDAPAGSPGHAAAPARRWSRPNCREIKTKPDAARFAIAGRGLFQFNA